MTVMTLRKALDVVPLIEGAGEGNGVAQRHESPRTHERKRAAAAGLDEVDASKQ